MPLYLSGISPYEGKEDEGQAYRGQHDMAQQNNQVDRSRAPHRRQFLGAKLPIVVEVPEYRLRRREVVSHVRQQEQHGECHSRENRPLMGFHVLLLDEIERHQQHHSGQGIHRGVEGRQEAKVHPFWQRDFHPAHQADEYQYHACDNPGGDVQLFRQLEVLLHACLFFRLWIVDNICFFGGV